MLLLLEGRGLVARDPHPSDGRARSVALTPRGRRAYRKMHEGSEAFRAGLLAAAGPDQAETLLAMLLRLTRALAKAEGRPAGADDGARD
jgi:DNA-binding MarR family transcriptional regulator